MPYVFAGESVFVPSFEDQIRRTRKDTGKNRMHTCFAPGRIRIIAERPRLSAKKGYACLIDGLIHKDLDVISAGQAVLADIQLDDAVVFLKVGAGTHGEILGCGGINVIAALLMFSFQQHHGQRTAGKAAVEDDSVLIFLILT